MSKIKDEINRNINKERNKDEIEAEASNYIKNPLVFLYECLFYKETEQTFNFSIKYEIEDIMPSSGRNID